MEKKKNEELQSRREFFKKAAKGALPILAAVVLAGVPAIVNAEETPMGCKKGCSYQCSIGCKNTCDNGCSSGCKGSCSSTCKYKCTSKEKSY